MCLQLWFKNSGTADLCRRFCCAVMIQQIHYSSSVRAVRLQWHGMCFTSILHRVEWSDKWADISKNNGLSAKEPCAASLVDKGGERLKEGGLRPQINPSHFKSQLLLRRWQKQQIRGTCPYLVGHQPLNSQKRLFNVEITKKKKKKTPRKQAKHTRAP